MENKTGFVALGLKLESREGPGKNGIRLIYSNRADCGLGGTHEDN